MVKTTFEKYFQKKVDYQGKIVPQSKNTVCTKCINNTIIINCTVKVSRSFERCFDKDYNN